ncbi:MAG: hypothetical protein KDI07_05280 [Anaerolineae bacterium]|nr:hypothetical protein [Anaerolineae bacterium]
MTLLTDITADLEPVFYDTDAGFAEVVSLATGTINGIFDNDYLLIDNSGSIGVEGSTPALRTLDADAQAVGATVTIRTVGYTVVEVQPNGLGETIHRLRET